MINEISSNANVYKFVSFLKYAFHNFNCYVLSFYQILFCFHCDCALADLKIKTIREEHLS
jgi:hypothetical protein